MSQQAALPGFQKTRGARFSECRCYRYSLWRIWGDGPLANWIMCNPSKADEWDNDPTVERVERRSIKLGYGGFVVTNAHGLCATDPEEMKAAADSVGPENDAEILARAGECPIVICAWGNDAAHRGRTRAVRELLNPVWDKVHVLRLTAAGEPGHPLYLPYALTPVPWDF